MTLLNKHMTNVSPSVSIKMIFLRFRISIASGNGSTTEVAVGVITALAITEPLMMPTRMATPLSGM